MWCTEVAAGAVLTFWNVVPGDIGDHWRSSRRRLQLCSRLMRFGTVAFSNFQSSSATDVTNGSTLLFRLCGRVHD
jgi:hypothetical protein